MNAIPTETLQAETFFRALADSTRLHILLLLVQEQELCVCELTYALELDQPKASRHLANLRNLGVVTDRRDGTWVFYRIHPRLPHWAQQILNTAKQGVEQPYFTQLNHRLQQMPGRPTRSAKPSAEA